MEKKTLQMVFATQGGSTMTISVNDPKANLTEEEVSTVMEELITLGVFMFFASENSSLLQFFSLGTCGEFLC
ncbi:MAG: DUF2922 domain-containing protein [Epulopiscium sp.]|nr:DUF2922 domain-containing protein [Candidatus Epulonipiscium sp.]